MKKLIIFTLIFFFPLFCFASENSKSIDLKPCCQQSLSITDVAQTGLDITGDISFSGFINLEQLPSIDGVNMVIASKWRARANYLSYQIFIGTDDRLYVEYTDNGNWTDHSTQIYTTDVIVNSDDLEKFFHIAVGVDVSEHTGYFYRNNATVAISYGNTFATSIYDAIVSFKVGANGDYNNVPRFFYNGKIDKLGVWSRLINSDDVAELYNTGLGISFGDMSVSLKTNLVGYWDFEDDLLDETANNNDLTNNNGATYSVDVPLSDAFIKIFYATGVLAFVMSIKLTFKGLCF